MILVLWQWSRSSEAGGRSSPRGAVCAGAGALHAAAAQGGVPHHGCELRVPRCAVGGHHPLQIVLSLVEDNVKAGTKACAARLRVLNGRLESRQAMM